MAHTTIVIFGFRLELTESELGSLEDRSHPALVSARKVGLQHYWGNFGAPCERYLLFISRLLAKVGDEDKAEISIPADQLPGIFLDVAKRAREAGFPQDLSLMCQFQPDA